jgi:hypothetical protein
MIIERLQLTAFIRAEHPDWPAERVQREVATRLGR